MLRRLAVFVKKSRDHRSREGGFGAGRAFPVPDGWYKLKWTIPVDPIDESCGQDDFSASRPTFRQGRTKERHEDRLQIPVEKLRWTCDPDTLGLESTADVADMGDEVIAQERAVSALKFGMKM
jgi:hypothetical protein